MTNSTASRPRPRFGFPASLLTSVLMGLASSVGPARATVLFDSDAHSVFTLIDAGGMKVSASPTFVPMGSDTTSAGTGTASIDADTQTPPAGSVLLSPVDSAGKCPIDAVCAVEQSSEVSGSASAPAGFAEAKVLNSFLITLDNSGTTSTSIAVATFLFEIDWLGALSRTDVATETASAFPFFHLSGFAPSGTETLKVDDGSGAGFVGAPELKVEKMIDLLPATGPLTASTSGTASFTIEVTVPGGSKDEFEVITDSSGTADHMPVDEPPAALLLGIGAIVLTLGSPARKRFPRRGPAPGARFGREQTSGRTPSTL